MPTPFDETSLAQRPDGLRLRRIQARDDAAIASIIRQVMTEFGAVGPQYSIADPEVDHMSRAYGAGGSAYHIVENNEKILGGAGFGALAGGPEDVCELRKMYVLPEGRGLGLGRMLLEHCLEEARHLGYKRCYLESLANLTAAIALYQRHGFQELAAPMGSTGHCGCDIWMLLSL